MYNETRGLVNSTVRGNKKLPSEVYLVNRTKKEYISFYGLPASKGNEINKCHVCCAIITKYMLENMGNEISLINSGWGEWPFPNGNIEELKAFTEVTETYISLLQKAEILTFIKSEDEEGLLIYEAKFNNKKTSKNV